MDHGLEVASIELMNSDGTCGDGKHSNSKQKQVVTKLPYRTAQIRLVSSHPEVYEPCDDSFVLVDALLADRANLLDQQPAICMEIGCGSGYVITSLAMMLGQEANGVQYFATDINPHAIRVTSETLEAHGVRAELVLSNIASGLENRLAGLVDVIVVNPPYVPTPEEEVGASGIVSSWAGGYNGRVVIDKILPAADNLLSDKGWLYMVILAANNPAQICRQMGEKGYIAKIILQRSTEEESLHVIKFWRDPERLLEAKKAAAEKSSPTKVFGSMLSQISRFPFFSAGSNNSSTSANGD